MKTLEHSHIKGVNINGNMHQFYVYEDNGVMWSVDKSETNRLLGKEADIFVFLHNNIDSYVEQSDIMKAIWGRDFKPRDTLYIFLHRLKKKISPQFDIIRTRGRVVLKENIET